MLADRYPTALVTGASTGLGRAFVDMLLNEGVRVWGTGRDPARLPARAGFTPVALDLDADSSVEAAFQLAEGAAGGLDLVVNSAGYGLYGPFTARDFADWRRQLEAMFVRTLQLSHLALRSMCARRRGALALYIQSGWDVRFASELKHAEQGLLESLATQQTITEAIAVGSRSKKAYPKRYVSVPNGEKRSIAIYPETVVRRQA